MPQLPRIAIASIQRQIDCTPLLWALLSALECSGLRVQHFLSRACFVAHDGATTITGRPPRQLDSWLMSEADCRRMFASGCRSSDIAVVDGSFVPPSCSLSAGSDLETLCVWLDLPTLVVVDVRQVSGCGLPARPERVDGLLLDGVRDAAELARFQTQFEMLWQVPVLGALGEVAVLREAAAALPPGRPPTIELCRALGEELLRHADPQRIYSLAARPFPCCRIPADEVLEGGPPLHVAVAYDDAFYCYFPDALEMLEARGATISDFSPLRDERLPSGTDLVYIGCGHPEHYAATLAENDCMMLALKSHLCGGKRMYAESGGLAYLCQQIETADGQTWPMVGALQATARLNAAPAPPVPLELELAGETWLGAPPLALRGYLNSRWNLAPAGGLQRCCATAGHELDVVGRHQALGSRLHVNFATQANLLDSFFSPHVKGGMAPPPALSAPISPAKYSVDGVCGPVVTARAAASRRSAAVFAICWQAAPVVGSAPGFDTFAGRHDTHGFDHASARPTFGL